MAVAHPLKWFIAIDGSDISAQGYELAVAMLHHSSGVDSSFAAIKDRFVVGHVYGSTQLQVLRLLDFQSEDVIVPF